MGPAGLMLISFSEITFLTLYSLVTGTHYRNKLMKWNLVESLQSWEEEDVNLGESQDLRALCWDLQLIDPKFEIAYYYSNIRQDWDNRGYFKK